MVQICLFILTKVYFMPRLLARIRFDFLFFFFLPQQIIESNYNLINRLVLHFNACEQNPVFFKLIQTHFETKSMI